MSKVEISRHEWEDGYRRLEATARQDPAEHRRLLDELRVVGDELRRRLGGPFELAELADLYRTADQWAAEALEESGLPGDWTRSLALVEAAAFHLYARGARDYEP